MEQEIKIFEHEAFGKIRVVIIDNEPWFVAVDVCKALEIQNSRDTLSRLDDKEKRFVFIPARGVISTDTRGGYQSMSAVNEPGLYKIVFSSRKKEAIEFQNWVYYEVLPSIRKYGYYSLVQLAPVVAKPVHVPNPNRVAGQHKDARVYVVKVSDGTVKIGQSCNVKAHKSNIQSVSKVKLGEPHTTSLMPRKIACSVEKACKDIFSSFNVKGEFFSVDFEMACKVLDILERLVATLPAVLEKELLVKAGNIFVDKKPV